jgi:hypothetical protein
MGFTSHVTEEVIGGSTIAIFLNDFPGFLNRSREHSRSWTTIRILPSSATQPVALQGRGTAGDCKWYPSHSIDVICSKVCAIVASRRVVFSKIEIIESNGETR